MDEQKEMQLYDDVEDYVNYLRGIRGLSDSTIKQYLGYYVHFKKIPIKQRRIELFLEKRNNNSVCRGFILSYLEFLKIDHKFKIPKSKTGRAKKRIIKDMSKREVEIMLKRKEHEDFKDWLFFNILYFGALRRSEIIKIKIQDFHWEDWFSNTENDCYLHIFGKGKKEREVLIPTNVMEKLFEMLLSKGFVSEKMDDEDVLEKLKTAEIKLFNKVSERGSLRIINRISKTIIGKRYGMHEIRHTRATHMYNAGVPVKMIQIYLGHSNQATTEIYLHLSEKETLRSISNIMRNND